jgi:hypothetical protein
MIKNTKPMITNAGSIVHSACDGGVEYLPVLGRWSEFSFHSFHTGKLRIMSPKARCTATETSLSLI